MTEHDQTHWTVKLLYKTLYGGAQLAAFVFVLIILSIAFMVYMGHRADADARALCAQATPGRSFDQFFQTLEPEVKKRHVDKKKEGEHVFVFFALDPDSTSICKVKVREGKIVSQVIAADEVPSAEMESTVNKEE